MKTLLIVASLALVSVALAAPGTTAANPARTGPNGDCTDFLALYNVPGAQSPTSVVITVDPSTFYAVSQTGGAEVYVDFYAADGSWITYNGVGVHSGKVPGSAAYALICVGATGLDWPFEAPAVGATWTYQDGL